MSRRLMISALLISSTLPASADPVLDMMRTLSKDGPIYAYEMTYIGEGVEASGKIDPSQPEGDRIELYDLDESEMTDEFRDGLRDIDAEADGDIWCADFADLVPEAPRQTGQDDTSVTYAFTPQPNEDAERSEQKMMEKMNGTITLDRSDGAVLAFSMVLPEPYKPAFVAKINRFEMDAACGRAPDGRTYVERFDFAISGSAMMQSFEESVTRRITRLLDPVG